MGSDVRDVLCLAPVPPHGGGRGSTAGGVCGAVDQPVDVGIGAPLFRGMRSRAGCPRSKRGDAPRHADDTRDAMFPVYSGPLPPPWGRIRERGCAFFLPHDLRLEGLFQVQARERLEAVPCFAMPSPIPSISVAFLAPFLTTGSVTAAPARVARNFTRLLPFGRPPQCPAGYSMAFKMVSRTTAVRPP